MLIQKKQDGEQIRDLPRTTQLVIGKVGIRAHIANR